MKTYRSLKRAQGLRKSRKGIRSRSAKRERVYGDERRLYARVLREEPVCRVCNERPSTDAHHILPRSSGRERLERSNLMGVCRQCHEMLTNPNAVERGIALAMGWVRTRHERRAT